MNLKSKPGAVCYGMAKILPAKKTMLVLLVCLVTQLSAAVYGQTITLHEKNTTLENILLKIEKQSSYHFVYESKMDILKTKKISIHAEKAKVKDVLDQCFTGLPITYAIIQQTITIKSTGSGDQLAEAETVRVAGSVTDETGKPLSGVSVTLKGSSVGIASDSTGNYDLTLPGKEGTIVFSSVGYETLESTLNGSPTLNVSLKPSSNSLNEVVVVGYGTQSKAKVSGAITTIVNKDIALSPAANLGAGLAGRMSGVVINNRGGEPGNESVEIFIRGKSTNGDATPLYVIDGIPRDYNALSFLPPNEIESMSVLKDASAAIYGSRAANGVILVTTKRGKAGKPVISLIYNQALIQQERVPESADANLYAAMVNLQQRLKGLPEPYSAEDLELFRNGKDPLLHPNTNWQKLILRPWFNQQRADVSVTGGNQDVKYFIAAGLLTQNSPFRNSFTYNKEYHFRSNIDAQITKDLRVSLDISGRKRDNVSSHFDWAHIFLGLPTQVGIYPNGLYGSGRAGYSALNMARDPNYGYNNANAGNFMGTLSAEYKIPGVDGLSLLGNFAYDFDNNYLKNWIGVTYYYIYDPVTEQYNKYQSSHSASPSLRIEYPNGNSITSNLKLNYNRVFAQDHRVEAFVAFEQNTTNAYTIVAGRQNFASGSIPELFAGDANKNNQSNTGFSVKTGRQNLFGRFQYGFMDKYNLQFQFRYDGSQNFPVGKRYGFFPGVSGNWVISKENFLRDSRAIDYLKVRASWGELGNDKIGPYQYLTSYTYGNNYAFNGITNQGLSQTNAPNPNITWETARTTDIGLEGSLWKGLLSFEIDLFRTDRSNILTPRNSSVPSYTGLILPPENIGKTKNEGIEISLSHSRKISKDFRYNFAGNFTYAKNTVVFMDEVPGLPDWQRLQGKSLGSVVLYETEGIFKSQEQIDKTPHIAGVRPGGLIYKDTNKDGIINSLDQVRQPYSPTPRIVYGLNFSFNYKQLDLNLGFQGQAQAYGEKYSVLPFDPVGWGDFPSAQAHDIWTPENLNGTNPPPGQDFATGTTNTTWRFGSQAFLKLKTAEIGYTFSAGALKKAGIKNARIYFSGSNLFFIHDNYRDINLSPEQVNWGWGLNQQRVLNVGVNVTF